MNKFDSRNRNYFKFPNDSFNTINYTEQHQNINKSFSQFSESNSWCDSTCSHYKRSLGCRKNSNSKHLKNIQALKDITQTKNIQKCDYGNIYSNFENCKWYNE